MDSKVYTVTHEDLHTDMKRFEEENKQLKSRLLAIRERVQENAIAEEDSYFACGHKWNDLWRDHFRCWIDEGNNDL